MNRRVASCIAVIFLCAICMVLLVACGGTGSSSSSNSAPPTTPTTPGTGGGSSGGGTGGGNTGGGSSGGTSGGSSTQRDLIYVINGNSNDVHQAGAIYGFEFSAATNSASSVPGSPFSGVSPGPKALVYSPDGKFLYVVNDQQPVGVRGANCGSRASQVTSFSIDHSSGSLSMVETMLMQGSCEHGIAIDPQGKTLYMSGQALDSSAGVIEAVSVDGTGHMAFLPGSPFNIGKEWPQRIVIAPDGHELWVTVNTVADQVGIEYFARDKNTGAVNGNAPAQIANGGQTDVAVASTGTTLLSTSFSGSQVTAYRVDPSGLATTPTQTSTVAANSLRQVVIDSQGQYAAVATDSGIFMFTITGQGQLMQVPGSPFGGNTVSVAFDPAGAYLSAVSFWDTNGNSTVSVFSVNRTSGALTQSATGLHTEQFPAYAVMLTGN